MCSKCSNHNKPALFQVSNRRQAITWASVWQHPWRQTSSASHDELQQIHQLKCMSSFKGRNKMRQRNFDISPAMHYRDVIMGTIASQITSLTIVYSTVYSGADQRKHQNSASLTFVRGIHRGPVNSPHKWPVTRKMLPFDDVIMDIPCTTQV